MHTQVTYYSWCLTAFLILATSAVNVSAQSAGSCVLQRQFVNDKKVLQFYAVDELQGVAGRSRGECASECKKQATILPDEYRREVGTSTNIDVVCIYDDGGSGHKNGKALFEASGPVSKLKEPRKAAASRSPALSGTQTAPVSKPIMKITPPTEENPMGRNEFAIPETDAAPKKKSVTDYMTPSRAGSSYIRQY